LSFALSPATLMDGTLTHLKEFFELSDEFERTMQRNFITTIVPGVVCIAGVYFTSFGLAAAMAAY
jgi:cation transport ATPase